MIKPDKSNSSPALRVPGVFFALLVGFSIYMGNEFQDRMDRDIGRFSERAAGKMPAPQVEAVRQLSMDTKSDVYFYVSGSVMQVALIILFLGSAQQNAMFILRKRIQGEEITESPEQRRKRLWITAIGVSVALIVGGAFFLINRQIVSSAASPPAECLKGK